jgi:hypothetical protein
MGLCKTGTSSLTEALNTLGIRTIHYPHDDQTYEDLRSGNYRLRIMDEYRGVTSIAVATYYAQLDAAFPGSKFILTVREKESWLRSIELHWRLLMSWWDNYPKFKRFHEYISACVYGSIGFHRDRFSYVYDLHVRNVQAYFAGRPDDFLVLDVCGGEGWENLCPFLGLPNPKVPFPHANEWMHRLMDAAKEIAHLIPAGETFVLVDGESFGNEVGAGRRKRALLERDGRDWGPPPDDETGIRELERARQAGASYLAIGWPAFWWLDYYREFHRHLRTHFPCVLENDRWVVFALPQPAPDDGTPRSPSTASETNRNGSLTLQATSKVAGGKS